MVLLILKKVLIIDGEGGSLALSEAFQKKFSDSIDVSIADSSEAGITKTTQWMPDMIILEIMIPGHQNGFDVLRQLKRDNKTKEIPIIIYTGLRGEKKAAIEEGALDCLLKQKITPNSVAEKITRYLKVSS